MKLIRWMEQHIRGGRKKDKEDKEKGKQSKKNRKFQRGFEEVNSIMKLQVIQFVIFCNRLTTEVDRSSPPPRGRRANDSHRLRSPSYISSLLAELLFAPISSRRYIALATGAAREHSGSAISSGLLWFSSQLKLS